MSLGNPSVPDKSSATPPEETNQLTPEALKAYAHPLRMAILRYLLDHGAATSTTLAKHLGESTGQTSYHLRQLAKHRLIEDVPGRGTGRERWWRGRSTNLDMATMLADEATSHAANALLADVLRKRSENLGRWLSSVPELYQRGDLDEDAIESRALHSESTLWLTAPELEELSTTLARTVTEFADRYRHRHDDGAPEGAVRIRAYIDVFPLVDVTQPETTSRDESVESDEQ